MHLYATKSASFPFVPPFSIHIRTEPQCFLRWKIPSNLRKSGVDFLDLTEAKTVRCKVLPARLLLPPPLKPSSGGKLSNWRKLQLCFQSTPWCKAVNPLPFLTTIKLIHKMAKDTFSYSLQFSALCCSKQYWRTDCFQVIFPWYFSILESRSKIKTTLEVFSQVKKEMKARLGMPIYNTV